MKNYISIIILLACTLTVTAQLETPALSPSATLQQTIGLTDIEINYSRPGVKGREIFGSKTLIPNGQNWRMGANSATKFTFSDDVTIATKKFKKGSYTVLAVPSAKTWELKWYVYDSEDWTTYEDKTPIISMNIPVATTPFVESLEMRFTNITMESAQLSMAWERTQINLPIKVETVAKTLKTIETTMAGPSLDDYFQAAVFLHENQTELPRALEYVQKVTASEYRLFFILTREARILKDLNKNKEALAAAKEALKLSEKAENNDFIKINQDIIDFSTFLYSNSSLPK